MLGLSETESKRLKDLQFMHNLIRSQEIDFSDARAAIIEKLKKLLFATGKEEKK